MIEPSPIQDAQTKAFWAVIQISKLQIIQGLFLPAPPYILLPPPYIFIFSKILLHNIPDYVI